MQRARYAILLHKSSNYKANSNMGRWHRVVGQRQVAVLPNVAPRVQVEAHLTLSFARLSDNMQTCDHLVVIGIAARWC